MDLTETGVERGLEEGNYIFWSKERSRLGESNRTPPFPLQNNDNWQQQQQQQQQQQKKKKP